MLPHAPRIAAGCMVYQIGFLEQLLINLTIRVPPQPAQEREPSRRRPWHQGPGDADCRWNLFSMYCRPVGQVIFANWLATTSAMSGKSPIHSSRRLVPGSRLVGGDLLLLSLRANRNSFRVRSRILGSYNDQGIWSVGAGFPNRRRDCHLVVT